MIVSVVIPSRNGRGLLEACLTSLRAQTFHEFEAIVVDNGSDDDSVAFLCERDPKVSVVELEANLGFARATNEGIRRAHGRYVVFLNNDVVAQPTWLAELVACAERHPRAAGVASKLLAASAGGAVIDRAGDLFTSWFRAYPRGQGEPDRGQYDREIEVFAASGAASLWRTDVLWELGLLDDDLFFSYEDVDLSFRARLAGYECWYAPRAIAFHVGGATSGGRPEFTYRHATRNRWSVIVQDVPGPLLARNAHRIAIAELLTLSRGVRERALGQLVAAYCDVVRSLPGWCRRRRQIQRGRRADIETIESALTSFYPELGRRIKNALRTRTGA
jgi:GT2 family glycosyltransferase